ncbi:MAG: restriction endonuclease subunit S [Prevotella sp.]|nr:restriction endonuclease subunit S [Prevotella sp.]
MKVDKSKWEVKKLGKVCNILNGYAFKSNLFKEDGERIIRISNINNGFIDIADAVYFNIEDYNVDLSKFVIYKNDILIALSGATTGKIGKYILDNISYLNQRVGLIRSKNNISNSFLYYYMRNKTKESLSLAYGVAQPNLSTKTIQNYVIPVPPLPEQQAIASELDAIQSLITKYREQLNDYDNLAKSIFNEMFGDVVSNDRGWERKRLLDISVSKGSYGAGSASAFMDLNRPRYIRITDIDDFGSLNDDYVVSENLNDDTQYLLKYGDMLFARTGATVGKTYIYNTSEPQIYAGYLIRFQLNLNLVNPIFVFYYTKTNFYKKWVLDQNTGAAQPNVNAKKYGNLPIPLPPLPLQQKYAARITAIEAQKAKVKLQITDLQTLFDSRMQYYFD